MKKQLRPVKLIRVGNSLALVVPANMVRGLGLNKGDILYCFLGHSNFLTYKLACEEEAECIAALIEDMPVINYDK